MGWFMIVTDPPPAPGGISGHDHGLPDSGAAVSRYPATPDSDPPGRGPPASGAPSAAHSQVPPLTPKIARTASSRVPHHFGGWFRVRLHCSGALGALPWGMG